MEIHAGEEKGGNGGGGATLAASWASGESCVGSADGERGDGSDEHGGFFWAGSRRERTMPPWRQPPTTSAEPRWLDAGVQKRAYLDICAVGGETTFCGVSGAYSCLCCCVSGGYLLAFRFFTVAILHVALRVHVGREGRDGVVDAGGEGWRWRAVGKRYQTHRAVAPPHPVPLP